MEGCMDGDGCLEEGTLSLCHWITERDTGTFNCISPPTTAKRCKSKLWGLTHVAHAAVSSEWIRKEGAECGDHSEWLIECGRKRSGLCGSSLCLLFSRFAFESCKTGLIQCEFMPGWPCAKCDLSEQIRFDIFVDHFVCLRFVLFLLLLLWMMFILLSSWHLIPIASRNFATWIDGEGDIDRYDRVCVYVLVLVVSIRETGTTAIDTGWGEEEEMGKYNSISITNPFSSFLCLSGVTLRPWRSWPLYLSLLADFSCDLCV